MHADRYKLAYNSKGKSLCSLPAVVRDTSAKRKTYARWK